MDRELEVIRDEMEETRANLANKLEALETQVRETVSSTSEAVTSTVEGVKDVVGTVSETVDTVTETLNISKQVEEHPWAALGIAVATGFVAAQLLGRWDSAREPPPRPQPAPTPPPEPQRQPVSPPRPAEEKGGVLPSVESLLPDMNGALGAVIGSLGSLAIGTMMGVIREVAAGSLPAEWKPEVTRMVDQVTTQLGGKPLQPLKQATEEEPGSSDDRLSRLEDLPSPMPPHQENATQDESSSEGGPRSRRGGRNAVGQKA